MKSGTRLRKAIAEAKAKIKSGKVQDAIVCSTLYTEEEKDTHTVIINPNFIKALRDKLQYESHYRYADVIETLLFGYYIKPVYIDDIGPGHTNL